MLLPAAGTLEEEEQELGAALLWVPGTLEKEWGPVLVAVVGALETRLEAESGVV